MPTSIHGDLVIGGSITGVSIGGSSRVQGDMGSTTVGGVTVQFQKGDNLAARQVVIGGSMTVTLMAGSSSLMTVNGISVRSAGHDLWVNGQKVSFSGEPTATSDEKRSEGLAALQKRFPGVEFAGDPAGVTIGDNVKIAEGAHIELAPGLSLTGMVKVGGTAVIGGGSIQNGTIDGTVMGGNLTDCTVAAGASVSGGNLEKVILRSGARISGGNVERSTLESGSRVSGGNVEYTTLSRDARISGGSVDNCLLHEGARISGGVVSYVQVPAGTSINGGVHEHTIDAQSAAKCGATVVVAGVSVGAGDVVIGHAARGLNKIASVHVSQSFGNVSGNVVGVKIDSL